MSVVNQSGLMTDAAFAQISSIAVKDAGLAIPTSKKALVQSRITRRMRTLGVASIEEYLALVDRNPKEKERKELISVLTTNVSSFYREKHHFQYLVNENLPALQTKAKSGLPLRFWSAGCSSGQEPYTIAIELLKFFNSQEVNNALILATDIDLKILDKAQNARYPHREMEPVSTEDRQMYFDVNDNQYSPNMALKSLIRFKELNLHGDWPMSGKFDVIFCRNVLIYFDDTHQRALWPKFHDALTPNGHLYLGHSERVHPIENSGFKSLGATIYQKIS